MSPLLRYRGLLQLRRVMSAPSDPRGVPDARRGFVAGEGAGAPSSNTEHAPPRGSPLCRDNGGSIHQTPTTTAPDRQGAGIARAMRDASRRGRIHACRPGGIQRTRDRAPTPTTKTESRARCASCETPPRARARHSVKATGNTFGRGCRGYRVRAAATPSSPLTAGFAEPDEGCPVVRLR